MTRRPRVATVLVHHAHPDDTLAAVAAAAAGDFPSTTVIVVDNGEDPGAQVAMRRALDENVTVLEPGANVGFGAAFNLAARTAVRRFGVDYVWALNPDTRARPDALGWLVRTADQHPDAALVGSRLVDGVGRIRADGGLIDPASGATRHEGRGVPEVARPARAAFDTDYANGASVLLRADLLPVLGGFTEDYFLYAEETDLALRARARGLRVLHEPRSVVVHEQRSTSSAPTPVFVYYVVRNRLVLAARHGFDLDAARGAVDLFVASCRAEVLAAQPGAAAAFDQLVQAALADGAALATGRSATPQEVGWP